MCFWAHVEAEAQVSGQKLLQLVSAVVHSDWHVLRGDLLALGIRLLAIQVLERRMSSATKCATCCRPLMNSRDWMLALFWGVDRCSFTSSGDVSSVISRDSASNRLGLSCRPLPLTLMASRWSGRGFAEVQAVHSVRAAVCPSGVPAPG